MVGEGAENDESRVFSVYVDAKNTKLINDSFSDLVRCTRGTVDKAEVVGSISSESAATIVQGRGGNIKDVVVNASVTKGHIFRQFSDNPDGSTPNVIVGANNLSTIGQVAAFTTGGTLTINETVLTSSTGSKVQSQSGLVEIYGSCKYSNSLIPSAKIGSEQYRAFGFGLKCDINILQASDGQYCYNTNNGASGLGTELVGYKSGWQAVFS